MTRQLALAVLIFFFALGSAQAQTCNGKIATIIGTQGDDDLVGTPDADIIVGLGGNDRITGAGGDDLICGGDGNDDLLGQTGDDLLIGDAGNDVLDGGEGEDFCDGVAGIDSASLDCELTDNTDTRVFPGTLIANDGFELNGALYVPVGDALTNGATRDVAIVVSHGAMGSFASSVPKIIGLQAAPLGFTVLALDRRDAGANGGDGTQLFEEATTDVGVAVNMLAALGYDSIYIAGHSQGTQNAAIYPSLTLDERVAGVGLYGTVDDGRRTAQEILFVLPGMYDQHVAEAESLIAQSRGDEIVAWPTVFGQDLFRTAYSFLSFWGPDTLSVVVREITRLDIPVLLLRADGDEFTPDAWSQNVRDTALTAGVDANYTVLDYPFPVGSFGGNAHGFINVERELITTTVDWLENKLPEAGTFNIQVVPTPNPSGNFAPVADAGTNTSFSGRQTAWLNGFGSMDIDGDELTYSWIQTSGQPLAVSGMASVSPQITPPLDPQSAEFQLTVSTADGLSDIDTVQVNFVETDLVVTSGSSGIDLLTLLFLTILLVIGQQRKRSTP